MKLKGNNLIIVNILATYARILLVAGMGLFSTRWVLKALGKEDFGLYSVVGGLIVFIAFLGSRLASSTQRFYAYAIGQGDPEEVKRWFNCALVLQIGFSALLVIIGVPIGNYLLDHVLNIPAGRLATCHWVYYLSILGAVGTMLTTPFLGMFYAEQRIFELSFWNVLQVALMFILALRLLSISGDLLLIYALGMVGIKLVIDLFQIFRALYLFKACKFQLFLNKAHFIELLSFTGWNLIGGVGEIFKNQGIAFLINLFSGPAINASYGIANQVSSQTNVISSAISHAISPEITSREGAGKRDKMISLSLRSSKFTTILTLLWFIPLFTEIDYVLRLWLYEIPEYTVIFCKIVLLSYLIENMSVGYSHAVSAYGKIAGYQVTLGGVRGLTFPLILIFFLMGFSADLALSGILVSSITLTISRLFWLKKLMNVSPILWWKHVFFKCLFISILSIILVCFLNEILEKSFQRLCIISITTFCCTILSSWLFGLDMDEKNFILTKIRRMMKK